MNERELLHSVHDLAWPPRQERQCIVPGHTAGHTCLVGAAEVTLAPLVETLSGWYGSPRNLATGGFVDPTVTEERGLPLLRPFGTAVREMRAWTLGGSWIGCGQITTQDGRRVVLIIADRPAPVIGDLPPDVTWLDRLVHLVGHQDHRRYAVDWTAVEARAGCGLPTDYKRMVERFGDGAFDSFIDIAVPGSPSDESDLVGDALRIAAWAASDGHSLWEPHQPFPAPGGLLRWASTEQADEFFLADRGPGPRQVAPSRMRRSGRVQPLRRLHHRVRLPPADRPDAPSLDGPLLRGTLVPGLRRLMIRRSSGRRHLVRQLSRRPPGRAVLRNLGRGGGPRDAVRSGCTARRRTAAPGGGRGVRGTRLVGVNTDQITSPDCEFAMAFSSTRRGARLARRLVAHRLDAWGHPYDSAVNETVTLLAAELSANAVSHGHVPGRDFHLRLTRAGGRVRVEVSDTRTERRPDPASAVLPDDDAESGRGLLLVAALSDAWGVHDRLPAGPGKTVWAELATSHDAQIE